MHEQYDTPEALRAFLRLCLDPGRGIRRTPEKLAEVLPEPLAERAAEFAPHLRELRHTAQALDAQAKTARKAYADALAAWIHGQDPEPAPDAGERYVIGRNGVFATLYDRQEQRLVVDNATAEHCRQVRDSLLATEGRPCVKCDALAPDHIGWAKGHLYVKPAPAAPRPVPLLDAVAAAYDAAVTHAARCGTCWPGMRLAEMCPDGQREALASLNQPECAHEAWEVTGEYRNAHGMWVKFRKCADCGEGLDSAVEPEPHHPDKAALARAGE